MSVHAKKHLTEEITVSVGKGKFKLFLVPKNKANGVLELLSDFEVARDEGKSVPWRDAFKELIEKYTEAGAALQGTRLKENMSQVELAKQLKINQADISNMENGRRPIGKKMAKRLAKVLKVDYRIFL